jgi:hypothetical protein
MEDYLNKYDSFTKIIVYDFKQGDGGIGDCIKFFMHTLHLCMKYNIKLYYLINNNLLEKFLTLKHDKMYINQLNILDSFMCNTHNVENINANVYNIVTPCLFYNIYNDNNITMAINEVFTFTEEVKLNGHRLNGNNVSNYISIHLRLGDKYLETDKSYIFLPNDTRSFFEERIYKVIEDNYNRNIIFFCDNNTFKLKLKNIYNNINITNCNIGHTGLLNTTHEQVLDTIAEFYLMTNSEKIYKW